MFVMRDPPPLILVGEESDEKMSDVNLDPPTFCSRNLDAIACPEATAETNSQCATRGFDRIQPDGSPIDIDCPNCDGNMQIGTIHERWKVCFCNQCRGFLVDNGILQVMAHDLRMEYRGPDDNPQPIDPAELNEHRVCPACEVVMDTHPYYGKGNIVINTCAPCGVTWMDHGELSTIIRAPGPRPAAGSSAVAPQCSYIPNDPFAEVMGEVGRVMIRSLRGFI